jgi:hypothetical protein
MVSGDDDGDDDLDPDACTGACAADDDLLGDNNNDGDDDDAVELNTEVTVDEIVSITIAKVSIITMDNIFIFCSMQFPTTLLRPFVIFYLIQTIVHFQLLKYLS